MFDVVIRNARVYDGTGEESYYADVAVENGVIVKVGNIEESGRIDIDAEGFALAPGFIDAHTHSDYQVFFDPGRLCKLRQGITLEVGGQCGWSRGPAAPDIPDAAREYLSAVINEGKTIVLYPTYTQLLEAIQDLKPGAHQVVFVGHHVLRGSVIGMENRPPTTEELERMKVLLEGAMQEGAQGLSTGLVYAPGIYCTTEEIVELAKIVAKYGGIYTAHIRSESDHLVEAVAEVIHIAKETGVRANISHLKVAFKKNRSKLDKVLRMIEQANEEGCDIFFDVYPYDASSATILSTLPPSYLSHDMDWLVNELSSSEGVDRLEKAIMQPTEIWGNPMLNAGFDKDLIVRADMTPDAVGKTVREYAEEKGVRDIEAYAYIISANRGNVVDVRFVMEEESLEMLYRHPLCTLGTDGLYRGGPNISHPRAFGSFPRYLGRFVRDKGILSYEEAIRRITGLPADRYELKGKGYIREGYDADLVLFDWNRIIDHATYKNPFLPNEGIEMVFVGGEAAVVCNRPTGICNGRVYKKECVRRCMETQ